MSEGPTEARSAAPAQPFVIAIDGPAASGKGTLARRLAEHFGLAHLDTGALYRAVAWRLIERGMPLDDEEAAIAAARAIGPKDLDDPRIRSEAASRGASHVAVMAGVRAALRRYQRDFAHHPPGGARGAVLDGRDIGTVVCPGATVKIYVTASAETRARRRAAELAARGEAADEALIRRELEERDARDASRRDSPLRAAADAHLLDTTNLDIESAFARAKEIVSMM